MKELVLRLCRICVRIEWLAFVNQNMFVVFADCIQWWAIQEGNVTMKRTRMVTGGEKRANNTMTTTINDQHTHHIETSSPSIINRYPSNCISSIWQLASTWQNMSWMGHIAQIWVTKRMLETTSLPANVIVNLQGETPDIFLLNFVKASTSPISTTEP